MGYGAMFYVMLPLYELFNSTAMDYCSKGFLFSWADLLGPPSYLQPMEETTDDYDYEINANGEITTTKRDDAETSSFMKAYLKAYGKEIKSFASAGAYDSSAPRFSGLAGLTEDVAMSWVIIDAIEVGVGLVSNIMTMIEMFFFQQ